MFEAWFESLKPGGCYLWPNTATAQPQMEIWRRVGATDFCLSSPRSRARTLLRTLIAWYRNRLLPADFHYLDLCCGDAVLLWQVRRAFPFSHCYGVDLLSYPFHERAREMGVRIYHVSLQSVVHSTPPQPLDVVSMFNTWWGWDRAQLSNADQDLPDRTEAWLRLHARYVILTITEDQERQLRDRGWFVFPIGPGEAAGVRMVGMFYARL